MRVLLPIVPMIMLAACSGSTNSVQSVRSSPVVSTATATPLPVATPSALPTATPPMASPSAAPPAAPAAPAVTSRSFPIFPLGNGGANGMVTVTRVGQSFGIAVRVSGLQPMTAHAVHLHAGNCGFAYGGQHLLVLGSIVAGAAGSGSLTTSVSVPISAARFVIVYAGLSAGRILGCADLGAI
jgi:hypothetical protein